MEADLQRHYGIDWQPGSTLEWRRLTVLLRHMPDDSVTRRLELPPEEADAPKWGAAEQILDDLRRLTHMEIVKGHKDPGPHPMSPWHRIKREQDQLRAARRRVKHLEAKQRDGERLARLAEQAAERDELEELRWLLADGTRP